MAFLIFTLLFLLLSILNIIVDKTSITAFTFWDILTTPIILVFAAIGHMKKAYTFIGIAGATALIIGAIFITPAWSDFGSWQFLKSLFLLLFGPTAILYGVKENKKKKLRNVSL